MCRQLTEAHRQPDEAPASDTSSPSRGPADTPAEGSGSAFKLNFDKKGRGGADQQQSGTTPSLRKGAPTQHDGGTRSKASLDRRSGSRSSSRGHETTNHQVRMVWGSVNDT